jgi:hypothetical protein
LVASSFDVVVDDGGIETTVFSENTSHLWEHHWVDLEAYLGKTVSLKFIWHQKTGEPVIHIDLDDISVGAWETPRLTSITPQGWDCKEAIPESVILNGENFINKPYVMFNDIQLSDTAVTWLDGSNLSVHLPVDLLPGVYSITVINPGGQITRFNNAFHYGCSVFHPIVTR